MKKLIIKTVLIILSVFFYAVANNYSRQFQFALVMKYVILFAAMIYVVYILIEWFSKIIIKEKYRSENIQKGLRWIKLISYALVFMLISTFQINYIEQTEVPSIASCKYYDNYHNLIYQSMYYDVCPELNIFTNTTDILEFSVTEFKEIELYDHTNTENLNSHITIHYENELITTIDSETKLVRTADYEGELTYYLIDTHHIIENSYDGSFSRLEKYAFRIVETSHIEDTYGSFYEFENDEYSINEYMTSYNDAEDSYEISCTETNTWCTNTSSFTITQDNDTVTITQPDLMQTVIHEAESLDYSSLDANNSDVVYGFTFNENYNLYVKTYGQSDVSIGGYRINTQEKNDKLFIYLDSSLFGWNSSDNIVYEISDEPYGIKIIQYEYQEYKPFNRKLDYYKKTNNETMYLNEIITIYVSKNYSYLQYEEYRFELLFKLYSPNSMADRDMIFTTPNYIRYYIENE